MSEPVRIDSHVHIYQSAEEGIAAKEGYEIWEYGPQDEVAISDVPGTVDDLLRSMAKAAMDKVVIVNLYVADERRPNLRKALPPNLGPSERERAEREIEARVREELMAFNRWACDVARDRPSIFPFVCADVLLFTGEENAAHVRDLAENQGARGVKLHGPAEGFFMVFPGTTSIRPSTESWPCPFSPWKRRKASSARTRNASCGTDTSPDFQHPAAAGVHQARLPQQIDRGCAAARHPGDAPFGRAACGRFRSGRTRDHGPGLELLHPRHFTKSRREDASTASHFHEKLACDAASFETPLRSADVVQEVDPLDRHLEPAVGESVQNVAHPLFQRGDPGSAWWSSKPASEVDRS